jgi:hypothetical protein
MRGRIVSPTALSESKYYVEQPSPAFAAEDTPHIHEHEWYLSSDGLFRSGNKLDGDVTVLLAMLARTSAARQWKR